MPDVMLYPMFRRGKSGFSELGEFGQQTGQSQGAVSRAGQCCCGENAERAGEGDKIFSVHQAEISYIDEETFSAEKICSQQRPRHHCHNKNSKRISIH